MKRQTLLTEALKALKKRQDKSENVFNTNVFKSEHRTILLETGYIKQIMKEWYRSSNPGEIPGDSTFFYASFWQFLSMYCKSNFKKNYSLGVDESIALLTASTIIPQNIAIGTKKGGNKTLTLEDNIRISIYKDASYNEKSDIDFNGLRIHSLEKILLKASDSIYKKRKEDMVILLSQKINHKRFIEICENMQRVQSGAQRAIGALRAVGKTHDADTLSKVLKRVYNDFNEIDPFEDSRNICRVKEVSPHAARIELHWEKNRKVIEDIFSNVSLLPQKKLIQAMQESYKRDAYHSLSIEGYRVTEELIERVSQGGWSPEKKPADIESRNALAARGYYLVFEEIKKWFNTPGFFENSTQETIKNYSDLYYTLFSPSVDAGILSASDLVGYRNKQVFIKGSRHVPLSQESLMDAMGTLERLLLEEDNFAVKAILGHHVFTFIHPYIDGNGRLGRFIMNTMFVSGGIPWTVVEVENRDEYMQSLEDASVKGDIEPFARFIYRLCVKETKTIATKE